MFSSNCLALFFSCCKKSNQTKDEPEEREFLLVHPVSDHRTKYSTKTLKPKSNFSQLSAELRQKSEKVKKLEVELSQLPREELGKRQALNEAIEMALSACADTERKITQIMQLETDRLQERESGDGIQLREDSQDSDGITIKEDQEKDYEWVDFLQSSPPGYKMR